MRRLERRLRRECPCRAPCNGYKPAFDLRPACRLNHHLKDHRNQLSFRCLQHIRYDSPRRFRLLSATRCRHWWIAETTTPGYGSAEKCNTRQAAFYRQLPQDRFLLCRCGCRLQTQRVQTQPIFILPPFRIVSFIGDVWAMLACAAPRRLWHRCSRSSSGRVRKAGVAPKPNQYAGEPSDRICVWR